MNKIKIVREDETIKLNVDGHEIGGLFDPIEFVFPLFTLPKLEAQHFLFTCSCGVPECAGWYEGFNVAFNAETVIWECLEKEEIPFPRLLEFDIREYRAAQEGCKDMLYDIAMSRSRRGPEELDEDEDPYWRYDVLRFDDPESLGELFRRCIEWYHRKETDHE